LTPVTFSGVPLTRSFPWQPSSTYTAAGVVVEGRTEGGNWTADASV